MIVGAISVPLVYGFLRTKKFYDGVLIVAPGYNTATFLQLNNIMIMVRLGMMLLMNTAPQYQKRNQPTLQQQSEGSSSSYWRQLRMSSITNYLDDDDDGGGEWVNVGTTKRKGSKSAARSPEDGAQASHAQVILVLVGLPGAGKSFFASKLEKESSSQYVRVNQDSLGTRKKCEASCRQALSRGKSVIIDRCNFDATQREHWLAVGKEFGVPCECVVFNYDKEVCIRRCKERANHETVDAGNAAIVIRGMAKEFRPPLPHSGQYQRHVTVNSFRKADEVVQSYLDRSSRDY